MTVASRTRREIHEDTLTNFDLMNIMKYIEKFECEVGKVVTAYTETAKVFKAFCDENRLRILELLRSGEKCACVLLDDLHITQSTLSHHMKILCDAGVVNGRKEGKWVHYSIDPVGAERAVKLLRQQVAIDLSCQNDKLCCCDKET